MIAPHIAKISDGFNLYDSAKSNMRPGEPVVLGEMELHLAKARRQSNESKASVYLHAFWFQLTIILKNFYESM